MQSADRGRQFRRAVLFVQAALELLGRRKHSMRWAFREIQGSSLVFLNRARQLAPFGIPGIEEPELGFDIAALTV